MLHRFLPSILCVLSFNVIVAQESLNLRSIETDSAGLRTASFVYFNSSGELSSILPQQLEILENGKRVSILRVSCTPVKEQLDVSSVLVLDVSGSMRFGGPNIALAQAAARAWVTALQETSEAAVVSFDDRVFLHQDLTANKTALFEAINQLSPRGGTDYAKAFTHPRMGGLAIAREARHKRIVVFLTDGFGSLDPDSVVAMAKTDSITVYCVTLGLNMPGVLQNIAERTGGLWFDNVTTVEQAVMAYQRIFVDATGVGGCTVVYRPPTTCIPDILIEARVVSSQSYSNYRIEPAFVASLQTSPTSVNFDSSGSSEKKVAVVCRGASSTIHSITTDRPDVFSVSGISLPKTLSPGDTLVVTVTCSPVNNTYVVGTLNINAEPCPSPVVYLSVGDVRQPPDRVTLRVVHPNGKERFPVRADTMLTWSGIPPDVPVRVEISTDAGRTWDLVADDALGLRRKWKAGTVTSDSCLLRVTQKNPSIDNQPLFTIPPGSYSHVAFSPDGAFLAAGEEPGPQGNADNPAPATIWSTSKGQLLHTLGSGEHVLFSSNGKYLLTWSRNSVTLYKVPTFQKQWSIGVKSKPVHCSFDNGAQRVLVAGAESDQTVVVDASTGSITHVLPRRWPKIEWADIAPTGKLVAVCERDSMIQIHNLENPSEAPRRISASDVPAFYRAAFSPDGKLLATTDASGGASLWDVQTLNEIKKLAVRKYKNDNTYLAFTPDARRIALETGRDETMLADIATGQHVVSIRRLPDVGGASHASILDDGYTLVLTTLNYATVYDAQTGVMLKRVPRGFGHPAGNAKNKLLAVIGTNRQINVYSIASPIVQQDVSDAFWSIYSPTLRLRPVRFSHRAVGQSADSMVVEAIHNPGSDTITVTNMRIEGAQASDFGVIAPARFSVAPGENINIQYSYHPTGVGERSALIVAETSVGLFNARITGPSRHAILAANALDKDLGVVPVGASVHINITDMIRNNGRADVTVRSIRSIGGDTKTIDLEPQEPFVMSPGAQHDLNVNILATTPGRYAALVEFVVDEINEPITATLFVRADSLHPRSWSGADPTTFRSIMLPTAVVPEEGTFTTGVYDVLGLSASYSVTDNIAVLIGGALPLFNRWFGATGYDASWSTAWSVGAKAGFELGRDWIIGGGYQFGQSFYDQDITPKLESKITFNALWSTVGYGTDDSRLNFYAGYAFKDHVTASDGQFRADAYLVGLAYDYRIAERWKVCGEVFYMRTMTFIPITITARYFRESDAFEIGASYVGLKENGSQSGGWPLVPMLTWVKRW